MHTVDSLSRDLARLGVEKEDVLFVHSSLKSLGPVCGGPASTIAALECSIGPGGTLLMPVFNLCSNDYEQRAASWDIKTSPSCVGYLTEFFRLMPGTMRSNHYSHSVAARGALAPWITKGHLAMAGHPSPWDRTPWGRTYGTHSPMLRGLQSHCKILLLGTTYVTCSYIHVAEVLYHAERLAQDSQARFWGANREACGLWWDTNHPSRAGQVGDAPCKLLDANSFVTLLLEELLRHPETYFRWRD